MVHQYIIKTKKIIIFIIKLILFRIINCRFINKTFKHHDFEIDNIFNWSGGFFGTDFFDIAEEQW